MERFDTSQSVELPAQHWAAIWALVGARLPELADKGVWNEGALQQAFAVAAAQYLGFIAGLRENAIEVRAHEGTPLGVFHLEGLTVMVTAPSGAK